MRLVDYLTKQKTPINDSTESWRHFLKDFRNTLLIKAKLIEINLYHARIYRYRLRDLLREANIPLDLTWIIIWINNLEAEYNFNEVTKLIVPDYQEISRIRALYDGSRE